LNNLETTQNLNSSENAVSFLIHFRCPECSKLYSSDPEKIYTERPEYTCTSCDTDFDISLLQALENPEVIGVKKPKSTPALENPAEQRTLDLPVLSKNKLSDEQEALEVELKHSLLAEMQNEKGELPQEETLELLWQDVLHSYSDRKVHAAFIKKCQSKGQIDFAAKMYGRILKNNPHDRVAKSFVAKIQMSAEAEAFVSAEQSGKILTKSFYITLVIVLTGLMLILTGLVLGQNKNLAGLGIALIFFTFAVKAFFQPRRPSVD